MFDFNDSLNDVAPVTPMLLSVDAMKKEIMIYRWISFVCLLLYSPHRLSSVSVVFDFNDSLNDVAPVSPISLSVDVKRNEE